MVFIFLLFGSLGSTAFAAQMCTPNGNGNINSTTAGYEQLVNSGQCAGINCECASLVKNYNPSLGAASSWQAGQHISADSCAPSGTPIATFNNFGSGSLTYGDAANPGGASGKSHSAILKGCSAAGMTVIEQYNSSGGVIETLIPWDKTGLQGGDKYYAITSPGAPGEAGLNTSNPNGETTSDGSGGMCDPATDNSTKVPTPTDLGSSMSADIIAGNLLNVLSRPEACWSCLVYERLANGTIGLFEETYNYFIVENKAAFLGAIAGIFTLVLIWKLMLIVSFQVGMASNVLAERWSDVFRYIARVMVVTSLFLFAGTTAYVTTSSDKDFVGARDFVDVPFAAGTSMACSVLTRSNAAMNLDSESSISCDRNAKPTSWINAHVEMAKTILYGFHQIGVKGISFGVYMMSAAVLSTINLAAASALTFSLTAFLSNVPQLVVTFLAGLVMAMSFIVFTVSFGMRFIDALLRGFVAIALAPIFFFLWVFDKTREMAHSAFRSVLFMGAVFVLSAITYSVAMSIVNWSFAIVPAATELASNVGSSAETMQMANDAVNCATGSYLSVSCLNTGSTAAFGVSNGLKNYAIDFFTGKDLGTTSINKVAQTAGEQTKVQWVAYFIVMASFGLATGLVQLAFTVAEALVSFKGSRKVDTGNMAFNSAESFGEAVSNAGHKGAGYAYEAPGKMLSRFGKR